MSNPAASESPQGTHPQSGARGTGDSGGQSRAGIGSGQGQDRATPDLERPAGGESNVRSDVERGEQDSGQDSLVNESTGAFKERP
jgi:hypothetical protein